MINFYRNLEHKIFSNEKVNPIVKTIIMLFFRPNVQHVTKPFWINVFQPWIAHGIQNVLFVLIVRNHLVMTAFTKKTKRLFVKNVIMVCLLPNVLNVVYLSRKISFLLWTLNGIRIVLFVPRVNNHLQMVTGSNMKELLIVKRISMP